MGIKDKIAKTVSDKDIKKPLENGNPFIALDLKEPEPEESHGEKILCLRCEKSTESFTNERGEKFCNICGTRRMQN